MASFTADQVKTHNKNNDIWIIIKKKVYNVTEFLSQHPGGEEVLMDMAGKDATTEFEDIGHSNDALEDLKKLYIGDLA